MKIGIVNAYEYPANIWAMQRHGAVLERGNNEEAILKMLARGRVDAAVIMTSDFEKPLQRAIDAGVAGSVQFAFRSGTMKAYVGFGVKHPRGDWARQKFNKGYERIAANGTRDSIKARWSKALHR
jgi:ABC-type amino acid transport substrate-binding protein